jgi:transcription initiation factor IIF auxiliary subunit
MALSIQQDTKYLGNGRWQWSVWVEGEPEELNRIDHVVYILDPTFHNPVRQIDDRSTKFRLDTSGWGTFTIYAKAVLQDGSEEPLQHDLLLVYPDGTPTAA